MVTAESVLGFGFLLVGGIWLERVLISRDMESRQLVIVVLSVVEDGFVVRDPLVCRSARRVFILFSVSCISLTMVTD